MPGIPLVTRETSSYSRSTLDQMCREDARGGAVLHLTEEEEIAAEESLSIYCKPVELYNILQRRSIGNPSFLQRCLLYKIQAKNKRRIQMTISMLVTLNGVVQSHNIFPLYVLLARLVSNIGVLEYSEVYRFSQPCVLTGFAGVEGSTQVQAHFVLPEMNKLASEVKSGSLHVLLVSFAGAQSSMHGIDLTKGHLENVGGCCLLGKIPLDSLCNFWEKSPNLGLGQRAEVTSPVDMNACFLKRWLKADIGTFISSLMTGNIIMNNLTLNCLTEDNCVLIQIPFNSETVNTSQLQVNISAEEVGAKEKSSYTCSDMSSSSSHVIRLRVGNVIFNYRYYNNKLQKTEVTEDFSCPFCLVKCASFKGLRYHLPSSHDLFNFEFWVGKLQESRITQEFQAVNISVNTDIWRSKIVADGIDPKQQTFFCSKKPKRKKPKNLIPNAKNAHDKTLSRQWGAGELLDKIGVENHYSDVSGGKDLPATSMCGTEYGEHNLSRFYVSGVSGSAAQAYPDAECVEMVPGNNLAPPAMLQFAKTRKLSIERSDMRNRTLLHKRQFFHSHRAQSMETEQVMSDRDSEDEVDDDVADFEDRRMLDDFVDVTKDEKQMMHLWNSFVRKQRVLADGHIPWACEAFTRLHGHDLFLTPALMW
ncbi:polycomb group protein EMBRYONIC FLOWER 2-like isoform X1 [Populus alba x Populus x berolinensis]|uniref:Polycomb group protein EMBRYONIC FLOWER 2-like isoform X1 n=1 Tax=Populus alba x Populus x berolinensis TaxID=444605 RepID=A0AAD6RK80_9ROSI|nr:polycomb group protein EMBRYONIC FLOWER 2-like isoform X1 [Populus alba x Populus x berolinensis]